MVSLDPIQVIIWTLGPAFMLLMATFAWAAVKLARDCDRSTPVVRTRKSRKARIDVGRRDDEAA